MPRQRAEKGKLLFAGLFETLNSERGAVMNGLERLARSEKELAEQIRSDTSAMHELQDAPSPDQTKIDAFVSRIEWNMRIFEDRRKSIRYACEVPVIIEKRLFALDPRDCADDGAVMHRGWAQLPTGGAGCASATGSSMSVQPSVPSGYQATLT